jgi:hydroxyacylglutathione hydrolase
VLLRLVYDDLLAQAAYLIGCQRTGEAILIDPARDVDRYLTAAREAGVRIVAAAETHIHADFLSGARQLAQDHGVKLYLSDEGGPDWRYRWVDGLNAQLVKDGYRIRVGGVELKVVHTPGHTPEHICFLVTDRGSGAEEPMGMASGDFVFVGDLGRPDLLETAAGVAEAKEPSARRLAASARRFLEMPDWLQVWPGHGAGSACGKALGAVPQTTVGYERRFNSVLALVGDDDAFVRSILSGQGEPPLYFGRMKCLNRDGPPSLAAMPVPRAMDVPDTRRVAVLDTRSREEFDAAHLPGSLTAPFGANLCAVAGSYVTPDEPVHLIVDETRLERAVRALVRIGIDRIEGWTSPSRLVKTSGLVPFPQVGVAELAARAAGAAVLDVRSEEEHKAGWIDGAVHVPHTRLLERMAGVPAGRPLLVHCQAGSRSILAAAMLRRRGFDAIDVRGGMAAWVAGGLPVVREAAGTAVSPR